MSPSVQVAVKSCCMMWSRSISESEKPRMRAPPARSAPFSCSQIAASTGDDLQIVGDELQRLLHVLRIREAR